MRKDNQFLKTVNEETVVLGAETILHSPAMVEVYGGLGLDFVWVDFEHNGPSPYSSSVFENLTRAAELSGTDLLVRVPEGNPSMIRKILDCGVRNILVPRVQTAEEVRSAVRASKFFYDNATGERGVSSSRSSIWGNREEEYPSTEDDSIGVGVMIEKEKAVIDLDEILAVPELEFVFIGHADLSVSLGHPFEFDHPRFIEATRTIESKCESAGIPMGAAVSGVDAAKSKIDDGYKIVRISKGEVAAVREQVGQRIQDLDEYR